MVGKNSEPCLMVAKRGSATDLTSVAVTIFSPSSVTTSETRNPRLPRNGLFFPVNSIPETSPVRVTLVPSSSTDADVSAVSSPAVVAIWICSTLHTPHPLSSSWSASPGNSPTPTSSRSPLPRRRNKDYITKGSSHQGKTFFDIFNSLVIIYAH